MKTVKVRFRLSTLLIAVAVIACGFAWIGRRGNRVTIDNHTGQTAIRVEVGVCGQNLHFENIPPWRFDVKMVFDRR
jgi:hypothetical protein